MIWISVLLLVPADASSQNPNDQPQCYDSQMKQVVKREQCSAGCCVYSNSYIPRQRGYRGKQLPHCGSQQECDAQSAENQAKQGGESSWSVVPQITAGLAGLVSLFVVIVGMTMRKRHHDQQMEKQRDSKLRKMLDDNLPAMMYDDLDDPEQQLDQDELCCICLDALEGSMVRKLHCSHVLHQHCFDHWCLDSSEKNRKQSSTSDNLVSSLGQCWTCPLCRNPVLPEVKKFGSMIAMCPEVPITTALRSAAAGRNDNRSPESVTHHSDETQNIVLPGMVFAEEFHYEESLGKSGDNSQDVRVDVDVTPLPPLARSLTLLSLNPSVKFQRRSQPLGHAAQVVKCSTFRRRRSSPHILMQKPE